MATGSMACHYDNPLYYVPSTFNTLECYTIYITMSHGEKIIVDAFNISFLPKENEW